MISCYDITKVTSHELYPRKKTHSLHKRVIAFSMYLLDFQECSEQAQEHSASVFFISFLQAKVWSANFIQIKGRDNCFY